MSSVESQPEAFLPHRVNFSLRPRYLYNFKLPRFKLEELMMVDASHCRNTFARVPFRVLSPAARLIQRE